jgi:phage/plasmid-associated DNA primase
LIGGKDTGKSTTMKLIQGVYGNLIGFLDADILVPKEKRFATGNGPTPYIAALDGLGASITMETEDGATLNTAMWKKLTGDDIIPARGLNEAPKSFANTAQIIIASNMLPKFNRHDNAVIERIVVIPFLINHAREATETKRPENIMKELEAEYPGIVRVLAEYYIKLKKEYSGVIPISKESKSYKTDVIAEVETDLDKFVNIYVSFEKNAMEEIKDIYEKYIAYFEFDENSVKRGEALSRSRFTRFILKNYKDDVNESIQRVKGSEPQRVLFGIRLKNPEEIVAGRAEKQKNNASTQVPAPAPTPAPKAAAPVPEAKDDVDPFS